MLKPGEQLLVEQTVRELPIVWHALRLLQRPSGAGAAAPSELRPVPLLQVDPKIMGGMVVDIGDKHIDMSISSRVKKIQQLVMQTL